VTGLAIRDVAVADSWAVAKLVSELGYPTSTSQMQRRLEAILNDDDYDTLVACKHGDVVGFIGTRSGPLCEDDGLYGQIMALAVAAKYQRRGIGRVLVRSAESKLVGRGVRVLVVTSGNHRADAHAFYEHCGYSFTGRRYKKVLETGRPTSACSRRRLVGW
jgi:ribosomal protein S18 acetylase RimI-like enzyme